MRFRSLSNFLYLALTTALLVGAGVVLLSYYAERGSFEAAYSTYRADREGTKALFLLLERLRLVPVRVTEDFTTLPARGLLFIIAPRGETELFSEDAFDPLEVDALDEWVKKGNTAVIVCDGRTQPLSKLNQRLVRGKLKNRVRSRTVQRLPLTESVETLVMQTDAYFQPKERAARPRRRRRSSSARAAVRSKFAPLKLKWSAVFGTDERPQVVTARRGKGTYILVADAYPVSNTGITEGDNVTFLLNLTRLYARDGMVFFDEFHHGHAASRGVIAYARQRSLHYFLIYLLAAVGVGLWRSGTRFGQVIPRWKDPRRESVEYAHAVATLYQSAGMRRYALEVCYNDFKKKLSRFVHHTGAWHAESVAAKLERKTKHHPREAVEISRAAEQALSSQNLSDAEVYQLCRRMAEFEKDFLE